ncbi:MAG: hypothetical protein IAE89_08465 [Anaerolineae bacterium]|nr:hypothetical protein [Anaerolineae bacterium]
MSTQTELLEKLEKIVRDLYSESQADEIVQTFEVVFQSQPDAENRRELLEYWIDFYRLQEYRRIKQRRRPTYLERSTPCSACGYPSSHRHHLWDVAAHGENKVTIQLCANCHELFHLMYNALVKRAEYSRKIARHVLLSGRLDYGVAGKLLGWVLATIRYEASNGWIDGGSGSRENVEKQLSWAEVIRIANQVAKAGT